jgi:hypothetical protein
MSPQIPPEPNGNTDTSHLQAHFFNKIGAFEPLPNIPANGGYRTGSRRSALETGTTLRAPNWPPRQAEENLRDVGTPAFPICWLAGAHAS